MRSLAVAGRRLVLKARLAAQGARDAVTAVIQSRRPTVPLEQVQRRLELLLTALYGRPIPIAAAKVGPSNWVERVSKFVDPDPRVRESTPSIDGEAIHLPTHLSARDGVDAAMARYRLLAVEQAERLTRGTATHAPLADPLERDLYLVREGAAVDAKIAHVLPGMLAALTGERRVALTRRPDWDGLTKAERDVEQFVRDALSNASDGDGDPPSDPATSLAWAKETAARIRRTHDDPRLARVRHQKAESLPTWWTWGYRGLPPASHWGTVTRSGAPRGGPAQVPRETPPPKNSMVRRPSTGWRQTHSHDAREGIADDQSVDTGRKTPHLDAHPDESDVESEHGSPINEAASEPWKDASAPRAYGGVGGAVHDDVTLQVADADELRRLPPGILYDEWDSDAGKYLARAATVRLHDSGDSDGSWTADMLQRHGALVRQVRQQFERLRARRSLLSRQRAGDDLDIAACVNAIVDRRIGQVPDDRLYMDARPARRGVAISLLVDVSGSTENRVTEELRIIDIEKIALLLAGEALDALGDLYAVYAFAGKNVFNVKVTTIKDFGERSGDAVRRRISALEPGGFTRLGAAVRHATHQLSRQSAGHRLLLILSDGRPNDVDRYQGPYGVDDSRQAIMEARASGVFPYCLTVDRDASEYLPRIFGSAGHTILQRPAQLPTALLRVVRALIRKP